MKNAKPKRRKIAVCLALAAIISLMSLQLVISARTITGVIIDADLSAEDRIIDSFVNDLGKFDKKGLELSKKASLTQAEFNAHQREAENLKNRVANIQNAFREVIRKLKAAGQWDNLDQIALAKVNDRNYQDFVRRDGFKRILDEAASNLSNSAADIGKPLDLLRQKLQAQGSESIFEPPNSTLALRAVPVAFQPEPAVFRDSLRCRAASLRLGIAGLVYGGTPKVAKAFDAYKCACEGVLCDAQ
jgi:hypothetical protein